jgi:hypothetical protein
MGEILQSGWRAAPCKDVETGFEAAQPMSVQLQPQLSKSKFVAGVQCLKRLYLQVYKSGLAADTGEETEAILQQGHEVGLLAQCAFPDGVAVRSDDRDLGEALAETQRLVARPEGFSRL